MKRIELNQKESGGAKFGAFSGIFVPTFLSIIGVILFLRLGFIVGSAGILPTVIIIVLAASVTFATGLSFSSVTTNIRISSGGVYSIISKTLGLEVGGSVGIPLYFAQVFSVALYLFGFTEAWQFLFPAHNSLVVLFASFVLILVLTAVSTDIAIKAQLLIFVVIVATILSIFASGDWLYKVISTPLLGAFKEFSFWELFALFFPAVTGIIAGVGLSGEIEDPKRQIPKGALTAIVITTFIYIVMAFRLGYSASSQELIEDTSILVKLSPFGLLVIIGILASTFSSALTTFVAAPRLLHAMAEKSLFPGSGFISRTSGKGVPQMAIIITSIPIVLTIFTANLNAVAPIITVFFLTTYSIINIVVFIEQSIGLVSFRPTLTIPRYIPLYGAASSMVFMFLINGFAGVLAMTFVFLSYLYMVKRRLVSREGDIRSGLFIALSEWAAKKVMTLPESTKHIWKPNILLPVVNTGTLLGNFPVIKSITYPNGTMTVLGLDISKLKSSPEDTRATEEERESQLRELPALVRKFGHEGIFTSSSTVSADNYTDAIVISLEAMRGQTFPPNVLFLPFKAERLPVESMERIFKVARKHKVGIILSDRDQEIGLGAEEDIHVWLSPGFLEKDIFEEKDIDLALLVAFRLFRNWAGNITIWLCVSDEKKGQAEKYLKRLLYEARFPPSTKMVISTNVFSKTLHEAPQGDIHIIPVTGYKDIETIKKIADMEEKSFFFIADSGREDVLA